MTGELALLVNEASYPSRVNRQVYERNTCHLLSINHSSFTHQSMQVPVLVNCLQVLRCLGNCGKQLPEPPSVWLPVHQRESWECCRRDLDHFMLTTSSCGCSMKFIACIMVLPKLLFENDRVRVSDLRLSPGDSIQTTLSFPTVRWQVDEGWHQGPNGQRVQVNDKNVVFDEAGAACFIENVGDDLYRQVWFEIKKEPMRTEEEVQKLLQSAIYSTDVGTTLLLENR